MAVFQDPRHFFNNPHTLPDPNALYNPVEDDRDWLLPARATPSPGRFASGEPAGLSQRERRHRAAATPSGGGLGEVDVHTCDYALSHWWMFQGPWLELASGPVRLGAGPTTPLAWTSGSAWKYSGR